MNRTEWLKSLKPNDEVCIDRHLLSDEIGIVERITPTGRIKIQGNTGLYINGKKSKGGFVSDYINELTDDMRLKIDLREKVHIIKNHKWTFSQKEKINAIYNILFGDSKL